MNFFQKLFKKETAQDSFAQLMIRGLREAGHPHHRYDESDFSIAILNPDTTVASTMNLHNAFREYQSVGKSDQQAVVERYVSMCTRLGAELPPLFEKAAVNLLPRVQPKQFFEMIKLQTLISQGGKLPAAATQFPEVPVGSHYVSSLIYDFPSHVVGLPSSQLATWNVSADEAHARAQANLRNITDEPLKQVAPGLFASPYEDNHAATRILLIDKIKNEATVRGRHVAFIPNRDTLLITGDADEDALGRILQLVNQSLDHPRPYLGIGMVLENDQWIEFMPNAESKHFQQFHNMRARAIAQIYAEQKELLEKLNQLTKTDVFVATAMLFQKGDNGNLTTLGAWTEGVDTLLPETDVISLTTPSTPKQPPMMVSFSDVHRVVGDLMVKTDMYPVRYRVRSFPSDAQRAQMKAI